MVKTIRKFSTLFILCALSLATAGCGEWKGSNTIDPEIDGDAMGEGPGLITGKEGGIVIYSDVWTGASPAGGPE